MKNKCTPWLAAFETLGLSGSGRGGCRHSAGAQQPGFCFFSGTSSLRAPHDFRVLAASPSAPLAVPGWARPRRQVRRTALCLPAAGSCEPFVILRQPSRTQHHLLEVRPLPGVQPDCSMVARGGMARFWSLESLQMGTYEDNMLSRVLIFQCF